MVVEVGRVVRGQEGVVEFPCLLGIEEGAVAVIKDEGRRGEEVPHVLVRRGVAVEGRHKDASRGDGQERIHNTQRTHKRGPQRHGAKLFIF